MKKTRKVVTRGAQGRNLFTRAILKLLDRREAELRSGRGSTIKDASELCRRGPKALRAS